MDFPGEVTKRVVIIGGGAAGFFAAITCATENPDIEVIILEKSAKLLSKVRVSGGGRCNVTHACFDLKELTSYYPRGGMELLGPFHVFSPKDTIEWFQAQRVVLKTEKDGRMFPVSDQSSTIVDSLMNASENAGVKIKLNSAVNSIRILDERQFEIELIDKSIIPANSIIVASGGSPGLKGFDWLSNMKHKIIEPVPSLFTFNIPGDSVTQLMGVSVDWVKVKILTTKFTSLGPMLITHWGMSGPAILKLSSVAARALSQLNYNFKIQIAWLKDVQEDELRNTLQKFRKDLARKKVSASNPFQLPKRLWEYLIHKVLTDLEKEWAQMTNDELRKLNSTLIADEYQVESKTTFKEEFVTCGGISLKEVDFKTMQSKLVPGLYFAGEVLDIDAVTGGFNFQAAWTTGYIAGRSAAAAL